MMQHKKSLCCIIVCTVTLAHSILATTLPLVTWVAESLSVLGKTYERSTPRVTHEGYPISWTTLGQVWNT